MSRTMKATVGLLTIGMGLQMPLLPSALGFGPPGLRPPLPGRGGPLPPGVVVGNSGRPQQAGAPQEIDPADLAVVASEEDKALDVDTAWKVLNDRADSEAKKNKFLSAFSVGGIPISEFAGHAGAAQKVVANKALSGALPLEAFDATIGAVAEYLVKTLPLDPAIAKAQEKQVLTVSPLENKASEDNLALAVALESLHAKLASSDAIHNNFLILSSKVQKAKEALEAAGAGKKWKVSDQLAPEGKNAPGFGEYDPDTIYTVNGSFYQIMEEENHRLYLQTTIKVWKPRTGAMVSSKSLRVEYRFHPYRMEWITKEADEALKANSKPAN